MTVIYGLVAPGTSEVRYVGRTDKPLDSRLLKHRQNAMRGYPPLISAWLRETEDVQIVVLRECAREQAAQTERAVVQEYHQLGHRLTNSHLLPRGAA